MAFCSKRLYYTSTCKNGMFQNIKRLYIYKHSKTLITAFYGAFRGSLIHLISFGHRPGIRANNALKWSLVCRLILFQ